MWVEDPLGICFGKKTHAPEKGLFCAVSHPVRFSLTGMVVLARETGKGDNYGQVVPS